MWCYETAQGNPIGSRNSNLQELLVGEGMIPLDMDSSYLLPGVPTDNTEGWAAFQAFTKCTHIAIITYQ